MDEHSYIKCLKCNTRNVNTDYCTNCGALINIVMKRRLERENKNLIKLEEQKAKTPGKMELLLEKGLRHPSSIVRFFSQAFYSVYLFLAFVIGGIIAAVIATAAG